MNSKYYFHHRKTWEMIVFQEVLHKNNYLPIGGSCKGLLLSIHYDQIPVSYSVECLFL